MAGSILDPNPAATILEEQRLGYNGTTLTEFTTTNEPQIVGNFEIAGSLASYAAPESISGWSGLGNGTVYIKNIPDSPTTGDVSAQFTDIVPVWDNVKMGWYGTGANANHRYLFKLEKTGASGYANKQFIAIQGSIETTGDITAGGDIAAIGSGTFGGALSAPTINTGQGAVECYAMNQATRTTDNVTFSVANVGTLYLNSARLLGWDFTGAAAGTVFTAINTLVPSVGNRCATLGRYRSSSFVRDVAYMERITTTEIRLYDTGGSIVTPIVSGSTSIIPGLVLFSPPTWI